MSALTVDPNGVWSRVLRLQQRRDAAAARGGKDATPTTAAAGGAEAVPTRWLRRAVWWRFLARATPAVSTLLKCLVVGALLVVIPILVLFLSGDLRSMPVPPRPLTNAAVAIALAIPPGLLAVLAVAWRQLDRRRILGTLWDVGTFWPRSFHPFAPPCYTERAVPELIRRMWWLHDNGGQVVVCAHSQGSVVAAAAVLSAKRRTVDQPIALITFGAPLRKLYRWAFPAWFTCERLCEIADGTTNLRARPWLNVYYPTDYIGGPIGRRHRWPPPPEGDQPGGDQEDTTDGRLNAVDRRLADPPTSVFVYGQNPAPILTHTGYWNDPRFRRIVDDAAAGAFPGSRSTPGDVVTRGDVLAGRL